MKLFDRAVEIGCNSPDEWVKTAFNEILAGIYLCGIEEEVYDNLINDLAYYIMEQLDIEESLFNWQSIEEWHYKEIHKLATHYLDFLEIKKIIAKSKISDEYNWEEICSKEMPVERINEQIVKDFKEQINWELKDLGRNKKEMIKEYNLIKNSI